MNIIEKLFRHPTFREKIQNLNSDELTISLGNYRQEYGKGVRKEICIDQNFGGRSLHILSIINDTNQQRSIFKYFIGIFKDSKIEEHIEFDSFEEIDKYIEKWFPEINQSLKKRVLEVS